MPTWIVGGAWSEWLLFTWNTPERGDGLVCIHLIYTASHPDQKKKCGN